MARSAVTVDTAKETSTKEQQSACVKCIRYFYTTQALWKVGVGIGAEKRRMNDEGLQRHEC